MENTNPKKPSKLPPIPLEFLLLSKITRYFGHRKYEGRVPCSKSEITRKFLYRRKKGALTPQEFYLRVLPAWIDRGLARKEPRLPGKRRQFYYFRSLTLEEVNGRLASAKALFDKNWAFYHDPRKPEYRHPDTHTAILRLQSEIRALRIEQAALLDQKVSAQVQSDSSASIGAGE
jgi:hypothetical protein